MDDEGGDFDDGMTDGEREAFRERMRAHERYREALAAELVQRRALVGQGNVDNGFMHTRGRDTSRLRRSPTARLLNSYPPSVRPRAHE